MLLRVVLFVSFFWGVSAQAGLITGSGSGGARLLGATDVNVAGVLYRVDFKSGSCAENFSGCDDSSDFAFPEREDALVAAQALLDQVLVDSEVGLFDSSPGLVGSCFQEDGCFVAFPYALSADGSLAQLISFLNSPMEPDVIGAGPPAWPVSENFFSNRDTTWAVWTRQEITSVPEPSTALLLGLMLVACWSSRRNAT